MFNWLRPFKHMDQRERAHVAAISVAKAKAEDMRTEARLQTESLVKVLDEFRERREAMRHDVE